MQACLSDEITISPYINNSGNRQGNTQTATTIERLESDGSEGVKKTQNLSMFINGITNFFEI